MRTMTEDWCATPRHISKHFLVFFFLFFLSNFCYSLVVTYSLHKKQSIFLNIKAILKSHNITCKWGLFKADFKENHRKKLLHRVIYSDINPTFNIQLCLDLFEQWLHIMDICSNKLENINIIFDNCFYLV